MKGFLAAALAAMLLLTVPGDALAAEEREVPEGYVEETYKEIAFFLPEWLTLSVRFTIGPCRTVMRII